MKEGVFIANLLNIKIIKLRAEYWEAMILDYFNIIHQKGTLPPYLRDTFSHVTMNERYMYVSWKRIFLQNMVNAAAIE